MILALLLSLTALAADPQLFFSDGRPSAKEAAMQAGLRPELLKEAEAAFDRLKPKNDRYMTIIDFRSHSSDYRLFLLDRKAGTVERHMVAHGAGSDKNGDGVAERFSNENNSHMSSLGAYLTAETYTGKHGLSMRLDGKDATNSKARARAIVVHGASYVVDGKRAGRSWGCPALDMRVIKDFIQKTKGGSLLYIGK